MAMVFLADGFSLKVVRNLFLSEKNDLFSN